MRHGTCRVFHTLFPWCEDHLASVWVRFCGFRVHSPMQHGHALCCRASGTRSACFVERKAVLRLPAKFYVPPLYRVAKEIFFLTGRRVHPGNVAIDGKGITAAALVVLTRPRAPLHAVSGPHRYGAAHPRASRIPDGRERARATLTPSP